MNLSKKLAVLAIAVGLAAPSAWAGSRLSVVGMADFGNQKISVASISANTDMKMGFGGGLLFEALFGKMYGLELGALYSMRKTASTGSTTAITYPYLEFPVLFRLWFGEVVGIGVGGYYAMGMGNVSGGGVSSSYSAANLKSSDMGLEGSLAFNIPMGKETHIRLEGRYLMGMTNIATNLTSPNSAKWSNIEALAGVTFNLGK